jgi:hypothetical protein
MLSSPSTHPPGMAALTIRYAAAGKSAPGTMTFASRDTLLSDVMVKLADTYRINVAESYLMSLDGKTLLKPNGTTACADTVGALIDLGIGTLARPVLLICRPSTRISNELAMSSTAPLSRVPTRNVVDCTLVEGIKTQLERDVEYMNECARIIVPDILRHPYVLVGRRLCERSRVLVSDAESTTLALKTKLHKLNRTHVSFARTIATLKATDVPSCLHLCLALTVPPKFRPVAYASLAEPMTLLTYFHEPDTNDAAFADTVAEWTPKALEQLVRHTNFADVFQTKVNELETVVSGFIKSHLDVMNDDHQALAALTDSDRIASLKATVDLAHTTCRKSLQVLADGDGADMEHLRGCVEANTLKIGEMQSACDAVARDFSTFKTLYSAVSAAAEMVLARTIDVLLKGDNLTQIMEGEHTLLDKLFFLRTLTSCLATTPFALLRWPVAPSPPLTMLTSVSVVKNLSIEFSCRVCTRITRKRRDSFTHCATSSATASLNTNLTSATSLSTWSTCTCCATPQAPRVTVPPTSLRASRRSSTSSRRWRASRRTSARANGCL